jgi:hypothetical protein
MRSRFVATLVALSAVLGAGATAAVASAAPIKYVWKVNGTTLGKGIEKKLTASASKSFVFKSKAGGLNVEIESSELKAEAGARIVGQVEKKEAGTSEAVLVFEKVKVLKPEGCEFNGHIIKTVVLGGKIVESAQSNQGTSGADLLLQPQTGSIFFEPTFIGASCGLKGIPLAFHGSVLAEILPYESEAITNTLRFAGAKEYIPLGGVTESSKLEWGSSAATITGEAAVTLTTKERFAAF